MRQKLLCALLLLAAAHTYAQYQEHIWYFGNSTAGLSFNTANQPFALSNKYMPFGIEGAFVATDPSTGQLLFYTSGNTIINSNHAVMQNGNLVFPAPAPTAVNGAQSVAVIEKPNAIATSQCGHFLYFINDANEGGASNKKGTIYMGEIDMNANGGLGAVIQQPQQILIPDAFTEQMFVIARPDNQGAWLILNNRLANRIEVYTVTAASTVNTTPVSTYVIPGVNWANYPAAPYYWMIGSMDYHQPTRKFAFNCSYLDEYNLYTGDFNDTTGALTNMTNAVQIASAGLVYTAYDLEFSPSGNLLYHSIAASTQGAGALQAYNMGTGVNSGNLNGAGGYTNLNYIGIKAGPDGRLWLNTNNGGNDFIPNRVIRSNFGIEAPVPNNNFVSFPLPVNSNSYRFPDFLSLPPSPIATADTASIINCDVDSVTVNVLTNDSSQGFGTLYVDGIVDTPQFGTAHLNGNQIVYTLNNLSFSGTDTVKYLVRNNVSCLAPGSIANLVINIT